MSVALVVPVKSFTIAKGRLAGVLTPPEREALARECAESVVRAGSPWPVYVVCESDDIAAWTRDIGAISVRAQGTGLNEAVADGVSAVRADGIDHVVIAHSDLPLARNFEHLVVADTATIVPDRHRDGTNVLSVPVARMFPTSYGARSFAAHLATAERLTLTVRVIDDSDLSLDLDTVDDLEELRRRTGITADNQHVNATGGNS